MEWNDEALKEMEERMTIRQVNYLTVSGFTLRHLEVLSFITKHAEGDRYIHHVVGNHQYDGIMCIRGMLFSFKTLPLTDDQQTFLKEQCRDVLIEPEIIIP